MPSSQDFQVTTDLTGQTAINGSEITNQVNNGYPASDKGLIITTTDTGVGTPDVPNAATTTKWQRYAWRRVPNAGDTTSAIKLYAWSPNAASHATYLRWVEVAMLAQVSALIAVMQYIETPGQDPNGVLTAARPCFAYDSNGNVWFQTSATSLSTGWVKLMGVD